MDVIVTTAQAAALLRQHPRTIARKCAAGEYRHATRDGRRWLLNLTREFPELFGKQDGREVLQHLTA